MKFRNQKNIIHYHKVTHNWHLSVENRVKKSETIWCHFSVSADAVDLRHSIQSMEIIGRSSRGYMRNRNVPRNRRKKSNSIDWNKYLWIYWRTHNASFARCVRFDEIQWIERTTSSMNVRQMQSVPSEPFNFAKNRNLEYANISKLNFISIEQSKALSDLKWFSFFIFHFSSLRKERQREIRAFWFCVA